MKAGDLYFLKDDFFYSFYSNTPPNTPTFRKGTPVLILSVRGNLLDLLIEDKKYIWDIWMFEEAIEKYND
jgi:hypothetical protein